MNKKMIVLAMGISLVFLLGCKELEQLSVTDDEPEKKPDIASSQSEESSVEAIGNKIFESSTRVKVSTEGVAFTIPQGWRGGVADEGFALENADIGYIIVIADNATETQSRQAMSDTQDLGEGLFMQPTSQVTKRGNTLLAEYEVFGTSQPSAGYVVKVFGDNAKGFAFIAIGLANQQAALKTAVDDMVNTLALFQATTAKSTSTTALTDSSNYWAQQLTGVRLTYFNTQSGFSEKFVISLCSDGSFSRNANTSGFDNSGFSAALQGGEAGSWSTSGNVNGGELRLNYNDGDVGIYSIEVNDEGLFLNGDRYFREDAGC